MKKISSLVIIVTCIILLSFLSFQSSAQCTNGKPDISLKKVRAYMSNYRQLVMHNGSGSAWQLVSLSKTDMDCLSTDVDSVKLIAASTSATNVNKLTTIAELCKNGTCLFYDTNVLFPLKAGRTKSASRTCPPPSNCGVPLLQEFNKK